MRRTVTPATLDGIELEPLTPVEIRAWHDALEPDSLVKQILARVLGDRDAFFDMPIAERILQRVLRRRR
jgi:hypothetical protein